MSQAGVVTRLALRELWISFRLLILLAAYVAAGTVVALFPAPVRPTLERLAVGIAVATVFGAAVAAGSMSEERSLGRAGWLVTRAVSRGTIVVGWYAALAAVSLAGLLASGALGWLAVANAIPRLDPLAFGVIIGGVATSSLAALAVGLLFGTLFSHRSAVIGAIGVCAVLGVAAWLAAPAALPLAGLAALAQLERPMATGMQGAGIGLVLAGAALVLARFSIGRVDL